MSDNIEFGTWSNELISIKLTYIKIKTEFWFIGKNAAESLDFTNTVNALKRHVFYDYKTTLEKIYDLDPSFKDKFKTAYFERFHIWPKKSQILINEPGLYQLADKSSHPDVESFQRWVYGTIKEIRERGYYCLPELENLSLEDRKRTTEYLVKYDIPDFIFIHPSGNIERKKIEICLKRDTIKVKTSYKLS